MSSILLRDFLYELSICSEKAACIARHIRFMYQNFDSMIEAKQCKTPHYIALYFYFTFFFFLVDENHQHLDADYKTLA